MFRNGCTKLTCHMGENVDGVISDNLDEVYLQGQYVF